MSARLYIVFAMLLLSVTGCRKPLCFEDYHPHQRPFRVIIDRQYMGDTEHRQMRVDFYSVSDGTHFTHYVTDTENEVYLPAGTYEAIVFNDDSEYTSFLDEADCHYFRAYMPEITRSEYNSLYGGHIMRVSSAGGAGTASGASAEATTRPQLERTIGQPDDLFVDRQSGFEVLPEAESALQKDIYFTPRNQVVAYNIRVDVIGLQYARQIRGVMTGTSPAKFLYSGERLFTGSTVMFDCLKGEGCLTTSVAAFGLTKVDPPVRAGDDSNVITFEFLLLDNTTYSVSFDIYDILTQELCCDGGDIDFRGITITLPKAESGEGMDGYLEDWYEETIEIR